MRFLRKCERCDKPRAKVLPCGHIAHMKCLKSRSRCPTCDEVISREDLILGIRETVKANNTCLKKVISLAKKRANDGTSKFGILLYEQHTGEQVRVPLLDMLLDFRTASSGDDISTLIATQLTQVLQDTDDNEDDDPVILESRPSCKCAESHTGEKCFHERDTQVLPDSAPVSSPRQKRASLPLEALKAHVSPKVLTSKMLPFDSFETQVVSCTPDLPLFNSPSLMWSSTTQLQDKDEYDDVYNGNANETIIEPLWS